MALKVIPTCLYFDRCNLINYHITIVQLKNSNLPNTKCGDIRSRMEILLITCIVFSRPTTPASTAELEIAGSDIDATGDAGLAG